MDKNMKTGLKALLIAALIGMTLFFGITFITTFWPVLLVVAVIYVAVASFNYFVRGLGWTINKTKGGR